MLEHGLKWRGKTAAQTALNARFGSQVKPPECDERSQFWQEVFWLANRGRPHTHGIPLPLPPLDIIDLAERLDLPTEPAEAVAVVGALDDAWIAWKDGKQQKKQS